MCTEECNSLRLNHILHTSFERAMEYVKNKTVDFDYYPYRRRVVDCNLIHVYQWMILLHSYIMRHVTDDRYLKDILIIAV
jgi:hypothetical protein